MVSSALSLWPLNKKLLVRRAGLYCTVENQHGKWLDRVTDGWKLSMTSDKQEDGNRDDLDRQWVESSLRSFSPGSALVHSKEDHQIITFPYLHPYILQDSTNKKKYWKWNKQFHKICRKLSAQGHTALWMFLKHAPGTHLCAMSSILLNYYIHSIAWTNWPECDFNLKM